MSNQRLVTSVVLVGLMILTSMQGLILENDVTTLENYHESENVVVDNQVFDERNYTLTDLRIDSSTNEVLLARPQVNWLNTQGNGLIMSTTGSCIVYVSQFDEFWLLGGRVDPNPQQSGDEGPTQVVQRFDNANKTWTPASHTMVNEQQYHGCAKHGNKVVTIGDHHPGSNPEVISTGMVQIYNIANSTWYEGTYMPSGAGVGMAGIAQNGNEVFVSGGVSRESRSDPSNRLLRYDITNDSWTELATMNANRYGHVLEYYHGKLYALGGFVRLQNSNGNWQTQPANHTEVYDPVNDTWTNHTVLPWKIMGMASTVYNDEIVLMGGYVTSPERKTYGYNPETGHLRRLGDIANPMFMSAMASGNNTILYAGGDASNWPFSTWWVNYLGDTQYDDSPAIATGWLTSDPIDLTQGQDGSATAHWVKLDGSTASGTGLELQYRISDNEFGLISSHWMPLDYTGNSSFYEIGNHTLIANNASLHPQESWIQYRINFSSTNIDPWTMPDFDGVEIGAHQSTFSGQIPNRINPYSEPTTISSIHVAYLQEQEYSLNISSHTLGINQNQPNEYANLAYFAHNDTYSVVDNGDLLVDSSVVISPSTNNEGITSIDWSFSLSQNATGDVLTYNISSRSPSYPEIGSYYAKTNHVGIDRNLTISDSNYFSSDERFNPLEEGDVLPSNTTLSVTLNANFLATGHPLNYGELEVRLHLNIAGMTAGLDNRPPEWFNVSTEWLEYVPGQQNSFGITIPSNTSGDALLIYEARSSQSMNVITNLNQFELVVDSETPILTNSIPTNGSYVNEDDREVRLSFADYGGLDNQTITALVWIESVHDSNNDSISQIEEYETYGHMVEYSGSTSTIILQIDDRLNSDHQHVRVLIQGDDKSGSSIEDADPSVGTLWWTTRTPHLSEILSVEPLYSIEELGVQVIEPNEKVGWSVTLRDGNGISDITEVSLLLGGQDNLGLTFQISNDACMPRDSRLQVFLEECTMSTQGDEITINFVLASTWSLNTRQLQNGRVDVKVTDIDGVNQSRFNNEWRISKNIDSIIGNLTDQNGEITGEIVQNWALKNDEFISFSGTLIHNFTQRNYNGGVRITWDGFIGQQEWQGSLSEFAVDGNFSVDIPAPLTQGILNQARILVKDSNDDSIIAEIALPRISIDSENPVLRQPIESTEYSRYHLRDVIVAANVEEEIGWNGNLTMTCQIKSDSTEWSPISSTLTPSSAYQGVSLFTFSFDFSAQGDPATLDSQAYLACWAEGMDDAGYTLQTASGNSQLDPWFTLPLNSEGPDLSLGDVEIPEFTSGQRLDLKIPVINVGEAIENRFNVTIETEINGETTVVARESFSRIDEETTRIVRLGFKIPDGKWKMIIKVDSEDIIPELDEENNELVLDYTSEGLSSSTLIVSSGIGLILVLAIAMLLIRRRGNQEVKQAISELVSESNDQSETGLTKKPAGPPKSISPNTNSSKPKGPPGSKTLAPINQDITQASKALDSLVPKTDSDKIETWEDLPPGGEYEYEMGQTIYNDPDGKKWRMNEDKSFSLVE